MTELGEIPEEWKVLNIEECANDIFLGLTSKVDYVESDGIPLIRASDISKGSLNFSEVRYISLKQHESLTKYRKVEKGDILVSKSGTLGTCCIVNVDKEFSIYESIIAIKTKKNILNSKYLLQLLKDNYTLSRMLNNKVGGAVGHLNLKTFKQLLIVVPTIEEQEKIASILSTVDEEIDNVDALIEKNKELKKGLMQTLLTKGIGHTKFKKTEIGEIPEEWEVKAFSELYAEKIRDFGSFSTTKLVKYVESGVPYLRSENFRENKIILDSVSYITNEVDELLDKSYVYNGNILFTKIGNIGCASVYRGELGQRCNSNATIAKIKIDENLYDSNYIVYFLNSIQCKKQYIGNIISTPPRINMGEINKFKISIPTLQEQQKIALILSEVDDKIEQYKNKKEKLEELKKGLMQQLLTGKIRTI